MKRYIIAISACILAMVVCANLLSAYEFPGQRFRIRNTAGEPDFFYMYDISLWSLDGNTAFCFDHYYRDTHIYTIPVNGGKAVEILDLNDDFGMEYPSVIGYDSNNVFTTNSDGSILTFVISLFDTTRGCIYDENQFNSPDNGIPHIMSMDTRSLETNCIVKSGSSPVLSPEGRYLIYRHFDDRIFLHPELVENHGVPVLYDTVTGIREFIETDERAGISCSAFTFAPDNTYIYYIKNYYEIFCEDNPRPEKLLPGTKEFGEYEIVRKPLHGGTVEKMTMRLQGYASNLDFSPDEKWLFFQNKTDILILDLSNGNVFNVFTGEPHIMARYEPTITRMHSHNNSIVLYELDGVAADPATDLFFWYFNPTFTYDGTKFIYSTHGGSNSHNGIRIVDFDPSLFVDNDSGENNQPEIFATLSNFPNPFNTETSLQFTLPEGGVTKLLIYDITGRKVRELADRFFIAGSHTIQWDGCDDAGNPVSSGIFITQLKSRDITATGRMTLVK